MIINGILCILMYLGVASALFNRNGPESTSVFARGLGPLATYTGPMDKGDEVGQVLTISACLVLFGVTMAVFRAMIF